MRHRKFADRWAKAHRTWAVPIAWALLAITIFFSSMTIRSVMVCAADAAAPAAANAENAPAKAAAEKPAAAPAPAAPAKPAADEKPAAAKGDAAKPADKKADKETATPKKDVEKDTSKKSRRDALEKALDEKPAREKDAEGGEEGVAEEKSKRNDGPNPKESVLVWLYTSMGTRYVIIFLAVTFNEIALVVMIVLGLRRKCLCPLELAETFEEKLDAKQYQEAYDIAKANNSFLGKVLAAGMANLSSGHDAALEAMHEVGEEQNMRLEQRNGHIALIAQLGPMLGLLATVDGIVRAFAVIAGKDVTPKPSELAQGIGVALVNTVVGLWLAIPSIIFYHLIRNRLSRMVLEVSIISVRLMKRFQKVSASVEDVEEVEDATELKVVKDVKEA
jgi:biopolymer transport protein ExbB